MSSHLNQKQIEDIRSVFLRITTEESSRTSVGSWTTESLLKSIGQDLVWAEETDGRVSAFLIARPMPDGFEILLLGTSPEHQRKGIMKGMLSNWLSRLGRGQKVWLEVHEGNVPARNLYENLGFVVQGKRPKYYPDGGAAILFEFIA